MRVSQITWENEFSRYAFSKSRARSPAAPIMTLKTAGKPPSQRYKHLRSTVRWRDFMRGAVR